LTPLWLSRTQAAISLDGGMKCSLCGATQKQSKYGTCQDCNSRPRIRSIASVLAAIAKELDPRPASLPCFVFSAVDTEQRLLQPIFPELHSVSLFGKYNKVHRTGIDARNLQDLPANSYAGHYSCTLFDYFVEPERAIAEAVRVLAPGGGFLSHIQHSRLTEDRRPPRAISVIRPKPGYYDHIPSDRHMLNVRVGALWFLESLSRAGRRARRMIGPKLREGDVRMGGSEP